MFLRVMKMLFALWLIHWADPYSAKMHQIFVLLQNMRWQISVINLLVWTSRAQQVE